MKKILSYPLILLSALSLRAQAAKDSELFLTMKKHDSIFFEKCFNQCDLKYLEKAIAPDFSFYHDQGGMQDRKVFLERVRQNICGDPNNKPIRRVVPESLEVYPLYNNGALYGVIQTGIHQFYRRQPNKAEVLTAIAKFTHVYLLQDGNWILKEGLSFDHKDK